MSDQWGPTPVAQQFPAVAPDGITKLLDVIARMRTEITESRASILSSVAKIVADLQAQVAATAAATAAVAAVNVTLAAQQATLAAQQVTLTAHVADIAALVGAQITGAGDNTYWSGTFTTAYASYAPVTIPIPAGFSIAQVTGISCVSTGAPAAEIKTRIAGVDSSPITLLSGPGAISYVRTLTGLSGGSITVESRVSVLSSATGIANTSVGVLFFR